MKIVYCINDVYTIGGVEMVTIAKANALAEIPDNHVWIVVADNRYSAMSRLKKVSVIDLAVHYYQNDGKGGYVSALIDFWKKSRFHCQRLEQMLNDINPDVVISDGRLSRYMVTNIKLKSNPVLIRELHSARDFRLHNATSCYSYWAACIGDVIDYHWKIKRYDKIVVLTEAEKSGSWKKWDKVTVIPNPLPHKSSHRSPLTEKVAITVGRLAHIKNFVSLISIWAKVNQSHPDWKLQIWGEGEERFKLEAQIVRLGLEGKVFLMGYTAEVQEKMNDASIFLLTSISEGFSLATLEAMSVGLPSVAYNCPGGIGYVVKDGETGFLVPMNDEDAFAENVCTLIENEELRNAMGKAALDESKQYSMEEITQRWMTLFQELLVKKRGI